MTRLGQMPEAPDIEVLLAAERLILPESQELRNRVMKRAIASLQHHTAVPLDILLPRPRRLKLGLAAVAVVMLTALCAAAFVAGYRMSRPAAAPVHKVSQSAQAQSTTAPSSSVTLTPPETTSQVAPPASGLVGSRVAVTAPREAAIRITDRDALAAELRVLQPARQAVARQEYSFALATIAEHQRQYSAGALSEEREALRIKALIGLGRHSEAKRAGAAFHKRFPRSALTVRIDEMLANKPL